MDNKNLVLGMAVFAAVLAIGLIILVIGALDAPPTQQELEEITEEVIKDPIFTGGGGDRLIVEKDEYQIVYLAAFDTFRISILESPFEQIRETAEKEFLSLMNNDEEIACALNVAISTPAWANEEFAGQDFGLRFCNE